MNKQHQNTIVFLLSLIAGLLLVACVIGGAMAYSQRSRSQISPGETNRLLEESRQRSAGVAVLEQMQRDGKPDEEIEAYAVKNVPGWRSGQ